MYTSLDISEFVFLFFYFLLSFFVCFRFPVCIIRLTIILYVPSRKQS